MNRLFDDDGIWVKAALHCHSTVSDGSLSPEGVVKFYAERGYKVISVTDHNVVTVLKKKFEGLLTVPGIELSIGKGRGGSSYHLVVLGLEEVSRPEVSNINELNSFLAEIEDRGGVSFIAHPYWSNLFSEDLYQLSNYVGIEVYNTGCDVEVAKGFSMVHWDQLLSLGKKVWGIAVDDAHGYFFPPIDADYGWTWIKLKDLEERELLEALKQGFFYSSMGPQVFEFNIEDNLLHMQLSPVTRVNIVSKNGKGFSISVATLMRIVSAWCSKSGDIRKVVDDVQIERFNDRVKLLITRGESWLRAFIKNSSIVGLTLKGLRFDDYFRVEVIDPRNRYAWLNPLFLG